MYTVPAADIVTDVPDTRRETTPDTSKTEEETKLSRAAQFVKPIDTDVIKAFSGDPLVMSRPWGAWRPHHGTAEAGIIGDPVRAVNNGSVTRVYDDVWGGTTVEIDHLDGLTVRYCGLGKGSTVSEGDEVKINDKIGNLSEIPAESADGAHFPIEADEDGMSAVMKIPVIKPAKRFFVIADKMLRILSPAVFCRPSLIIFIP